jgi:glycosyltransferase involved in cell wall biosynthesis
VVSLSTHESFGLSLAEALASGAKVVASDIPAHREMSDMVGGSVTWVAPGDHVATVAQAIELALKGPRREDPNLATRSWDDVGMETMAVYARVLNDP